MRIRGLRRISLVLLSLPWGSCAEPSRQPESPLAQLRERILAEFPIDAEPAIPANNPGTPEKIALGEALFFDPNLSSCGTIACASCHLPGEGFSDGFRISSGCKAATGRRNSNTIYETAFLSHLFWDGRVQSLEQQALGPVVDPAEMANTWDNVLNYLSTGRHPVTSQDFPDSRQFYRASFEKVFSGSVTSTNVAKALAAYERTIISRDAPFDRWLQGDDTALSTAQKRGAIVFFGRGRCSECHQPPSFTDSDFHNVAVPRRGFEKAELFPDNPRICEGIAPAVDPGRAGTPALFSSCSDLGRFKTPTLRNVELSAPYMHNGVFSTLEDVLQHYWSVGRGTTTPVLGSLDTRAKSIMLTDFGGHPEDLINLAEFLKALTGRQVPGPARGIAPPG